MAHPLTHLTCAQLFREHWIGAFCVHRARAYHINSPAQCALTSSSPAERLYGVSPTRPDHRTSENFKDGEAGSRLFATMFMYRLHYVPFLVKIDLRWNPA